MCPNCHSQTDTYAGKKNESGKNNRIHVLPPKHTCSVCGKALHRPTKSGMCKDCYNKQRAVDSNCPSAEELLEKKKELKSYVKMGKFYNTSDKTIKK